MFGLQTLTCLHDIPLVRSSTDKLQNVYAKAKDTSALIRLPCNLAETVADKSLKVAFTFMNPLVKPLSEHVRVIDDYTVQKIRQLETKYPVINTSPQEVVNTFNEKTEPVRNVMNSVKDTTTSTIQHGKETVSNAADSVFSFCQSHVPGMQRLSNNQQKRENGYAFSAIGSLINSAINSVQSTLIWFQMLAFFSLLKVKQVNDTILNKLPQVPVLFNLSQQILIKFGTLLDCVTTRIRPDDRTLTELKKPKQQSHVQPQYLFNRPVAKPNPSAATRRTAAVNKQETVSTPNNQFDGYSQQRAQTEFTFTNIGDIDELRESTDNYTVESTIEPSSSTNNIDIADLCARVNNRSDDDVIYSDLTNNTITIPDNQEPFIDDSS